jgi:hypothetical protein
MIQKIITFHEVFSHIFNMSPIPYEKFHSCDFTKNIWIFFIWKIIGIMLHAFVSKSILYVYQNVRWNQRKHASKIILNVLLK